MSRKIKTILLETFERLPRDEAGNPMAPGTPVQRVYRVLKITDSVEYHPGDVLIKSLVEGLCDNGTWKVTIANSKE